MQNWPNIESECTVRPLDSQAHLRLAERNKTLQDMLLKGNNQQQAPKPIPEMSQSPRTGCHDVFYSSYATLFLCLLGR